MSDINPTKQSPKSTQPNAELPDQLDPVTKYSQDYFLHEFVELGMGVCDGISSCLDIVEKGNSISLKPSPEAAEAFCALHSEKLLKLAMTSARLLGEYATKHIAWINDDSQPPSQVMEEAENKRVK